MNAPRAEGVPAGLVIAGVFGVGCFVVAAISGASPGLAVALGVGGGVVVGSLYAARQNPERLLPLACIAGAGALFASELMTTFQLSTTGEPLCNIGASGRHHFAMGILAIFAVAAVIVAVTSASKPAAIAVGIAGVIALILFLTIDLPHANNTGTLGGCSEATTGQFFEAKAIPQAGFWLEMVGALALALSGVALGTLNPEQLRAIRPGWLPGRKLEGDRKSRTTPTPSRGKPEAEQMSGDHDRPTRAARRRARARGGERG
jgi:hypothetical protein